MADPLDDKDDKIMEVLKCVPNTPHKCSICLSWIDTKIRNFPILRSDWFPQSHESPCINFTWNEKTQNCDEEELVKPCYSCVSQGMRADRYGKPMKASKKWEKLSPGINFDICSKCIEEGGKEKIVPKCDEDAGEECVVEQKGLRQTSRCLPPCDPPCIPNCEECVCANNRCTQRTCKNLCGTNTFCMVTDVKCQCKFRTRGSFDSGGFSECPPWEPTAEYYTEDDGKTACRCVCDVDPGDCAANEPFDSDICQCVYDPTIILGSLLP